MSNKLMIRHSILLLILLSLVACQNDRLGGLDGIADSSSTDSKGLITLSCDRSGGHLKLSIDAPIADHLGVWIDLNGDGRRADDGIEDVKVFNAYQEYQLSPTLKEINIYGAITYFAAADNDITKINIEKSQALSVLHLPLNKIQTIDLSKNSDLKAVDLSNNSLSHIDLSANRSLESLLLHANNLTELELERNAALQLLDCSNNQLSVIDVAQNGELKELVLYNNQLSTLNVAQNKRLNRLWIFGNAAINEEQYLELVSSLNKTTDGSLWLSNEEENDKLATQARLRGWTLE